MKQRTKRDLGILVGAIAIIGITAFANTQLRRGNLAEKYEALREKFETEQAAADSGFLKWELLRETKGKPKKVALVAAMRKLLTILNTMIKKDELWTEPKAM